MRYMEKEGPERGRTSGPNRLGEKTVEDAQLGSLTRGEEWEFRKEGKAGGLKGGQVSWGSPSESTREFPREVSSYPNSVGSRGLKTTPPVSGEKIQANPLEGPICSKD